MFELGFFLIQLAIYGFELLLQSWLLRLQVFCIYLHAVKSVSFLNLRSPVIGRDDPQRILDILSPSFYELSYRVVFQLGFGYPHQVSLKFRFLLELMPKNLLEPVDSVDATLGVNFGQKLPTT